MRAFTVLLDDLVHTLKISFYIHAHRIVRHLTNNDVMIFGMFRLPLSQCMLKIYHYNNFVNNWFNSCLVKEIMSMSK